MTTNIYCITCGKFTGMWNNGVREVAGQRRKCGGKLIRLMSDRNGV